jgi:hypothetical protein
MGTINATVVINVPALLVVDSMLAPPDGTNGAEYPNFKFTATGGYLPLTWKVTAGALPTGLTLSADGWLTGTPTAAGSFPISVTVTDSAPTAAMNSAAFTVVINNPPPPTVNNVAPPTATVDADYAGFQFTATGGLAPLVWSESGTLPGLVFSLDGLLSGTPTAAGRFPITVNVKDSLNRSEPGLPVIVRVSAARPAATFTATGSMATARTGHTATLLMSGKVLVAGGQTNASAELYDPAAASFTATGGMAAARNGHTATLLNSGKVLLVGGGAPTTELYDPAMGMFSATGNLIVQRSGQTATRLQDGSVLIAGGGNANAELYNPSTGMFSATGSMTDVRTGHIATLLVDGRVLMIGGGPTTAETYNPAANVFTVTTGSPEVGVPQKASRLTDGRVLITGTSVASQVFDPATTLFTSVGNVIVANRAPTASLLDDGTVLLAGGWRAIRYSRLGSACASQAFAERFAPESEGFTATGTLVTARDGHTATLLSDGSVLVIGGTIRSGSCLRPTVTALSSAELYK